MNAQDIASVSVPPAASERNARRLYWQQLGQPWLTEPEIDDERQKYLAERRATVLARSHLERAELRGAHLEDVHFRLTHLAGANLEQVFFKKYGHQP